MDDLSFIVRRYDEKSDYEMLSSWNEGKYNYMFKPEYVPKTTWIVEYEGKPLAVMALLCTNSSMVWAEGLLGNPNESGAKRKAAVQHLVWFCKKWARGEGYTRAFGMVPNAKLLLFYEDMGWKPTMDVVIPLGMEL